MKRISLVFILFWSSLSLASFEENSRRYLSVLEVKNTLGFYLPSVTNCNFEQGGGSALGMNSPLTGTPVSPSPTQATINWIVSCASSGLQYLPSAQGESSFYLLVGPEAKAIFQKEGHTPALFRKWSTLEKSLQKSIIRNMTELLLGSDHVINDFDLIAPDVLRERLFQGASKSSTVQDALSLIFINLALRDEFLSY